MAAVEIDLGKLSFDIDFHPSDNLVAAGLITGDLLLNRYNTDSQAQKLLEVNAHSESCRTVWFINEGRAIVTGSPDCSILATDIETGSEIVRLENSHGAAVNLTESTIASGDDEGCIKIRCNRKVSLESFWIGIYFDKERRLAGYGGVGFAQGPASLSWSYAVIGPSIWWFMPH